MPTLKLDGLRAWIEANGASLDFLLPPEVTHSNADAVPLAEPREEVRAAIVEAGYDKYVHRSNSAGQVAICCTKGERARE